MKRQSDTQRRRAYAVVLCAGVATLALVAAGAAAQDQRVGVAATAQTPATGTPPQAAARELRIGLDMVRNERIVTGAEGKTQLLFLDGSALTVGPNAELILDEFVYDPATETGRLAMTATKGVFRVVGGKISKTEPITLKTPTATLGIRGGIAMANVGGPTPGFFSFLFGKQMTIDGTGPDGQPIQQVVTRPGTGVPIGANGQVLPPVPIPPGVLTNQLSSLEGNRGQTGGAPERPTDPRVASTQIADLGSNLSPEVTGSEPAAGGEAAPAPLPLPTPPRTDTFSQADITPCAPGIVCPDAASASESNVGPFSNNPNLPPPGTVVVSGLGGRYKSTPGTGSTFGSAGDGSAAFDRPFTGATIDSNGIFRAFPGGDTFAAPVNPAGGFMSYNGAASPFGPITGTSFASANGDFFFFESVETNFIDERSFLFAGMPTPPATIPSANFGAYNLRRDFIGDSNIPFIQAAAGGSLAGSVSPAFVAFEGPQRKLVQASLAIVGAGDTQSSALSLIVGNLGGSGALVLDGQMRGSSGGALADPPNIFFGAAGFATDGLGNSTFGASGPDFFVLQSPGGIAGGPAGNYFPNNVGSRTPLPAGVGANRETGEFYGFINGVTRTTALDNSFSSLQLLTSQGSTPDENLVLVTTGSGLAAASSVSMSANVHTPIAERYGLQFGGNATHNNNAYIDNKRFGGTESTQFDSVFDSDGSVTTLPTPRLYMVSGGLTDISAILPPGVSACECAFMFWGFWGADIVNPFSNVRERIHLGQFVAGDLASATEIAALSGTASYTGHAIADVINAGRTYKAGGGFTLSYAFGPQTGTAMINNLDGRTYASTVSGSGAANLPSGALMQTAGVGMAANGSIGLAFFRNGATDVYAGVGGQFTVSNIAGYSATGIVVGQRTGP
jgi:trimeric autotransporter adhesin